MLSRTRIVCANNPKCCPDGKCDWVGDYGSYQEHISTCTNSPVYSSRISAGDCASEAKRESVNLQSEDLCMQEEAAETEGVTEVNDNEPVLDSDLPDSELTELVGALLDIKVQEPAEKLDFDTETTCSMPESLTEPSEDDSLENRDTVEVFQIDTTCADNVVAMQGSSAGKTAKAQQSKSKKQAKGQQPLSISKKEMSPEELKAQRAAMEWQASQYHAAQYQAAHYRAAQLQMVQWQWHCQAQAARQWQLAAASAQC
jgi:hypothetical protein